MSGEKIEVVHGPVTSIKALATKSVVSGDVQRIGDVAGFWLHDVEKNKNGHFCIAALLVNLPIPGDDDIVVGTELSLNPKGSNIIRGTAEPVAVLWESYPANTDRGLAVWGAAITGRNIIYLMSVSAIQDQTLKRYSAKFDLDDYKYLDFLGWHAGQRVPKIACSIRIRVSDIPVVADDAVDLSKDRTRFGISAANQATDHLLFVARNMSGNVLILDSGGGKSDTYNFDIFGVVDV